MDLILSGGDVIDGARSPRRRADVAIAAGRIAAIGDLADAPAARRLDVTGRCVAPGFIDVHNHSDGWLFREPHFTVKTRQGFTTEVLAADGIGYAPVDERTARQWIFYLRSLDGLRLDQYQGWQSLEEMLGALDGRTAQNFAAHVPYANLRALVCGWGRGAVDDFQMRQLQFEISAGMSAGAVGVSTGLDYIVQCHSTTDELAEACAAMAASRGLYVTHVRYKKGLLGGFREAVEIGRRAGVPVHISHLKGFDERHVSEVLEYVERARREVDLSFDVYPYQPGSTMLSYFLPYDAWDAGPLASSSRLHDPEVRARFRAGLKTQRLNLDQIRIAWLPSRENRPHQGRTLAQYVAAVGGAADDALYDLLLEERMAVLCVMDEGDDRLIHPFLQHDLFMLGTDGIYQQDACVHPRMFGSSGRLLGPCVRDWKLFSLEDAVHKMTGHPARRFGFSERGEVREGWWADLVVFDDREVTDLATFERPDQTTAGIEHVLVNGELVIEDGAACALSRMPGRRLFASRKD